MDMFDSPHRRLNLLTGEWVLVSPHRARRPWLGQVEKTPAKSLPEYDPTCYLCPGNERAGGVRNPPYRGTFVFDNDFAALLPGPALEPQSQISPLLSAEPEQGICRVVCFSPRHDLSLPEFDLTTLEDVIQIWTEQTADLGERDFINYVQVFENKGDVMGASNPHPHSQVWASGHIPNEPAKELTAQTAYLDQHQRSLLVDYIAEEHKRKERILASNDHFTALVPFWAIWPFETLISAHRSGLTRLIELTSAEVTALAEILKIITTRYDNLFEISFPYSMGFHQAPFDGQAHPEWILHAHFYPPLLAMPQRDITPESAAERLRSLSNVHYKHKNRLESVK
jgi:UDPglucose--hexose-1-phosphate uridylyltransferase